MISAIFKRTITIDGHKTSVTLEDEFWVGLREIAHRKNATLRSLITQIDDARERNNLSSAIRVFVLNQFRAHAHSADIQGHDSSLRNIIAPRPSNCDYSAFQATN